MPGPPPTPTPILNARGSWRAKVRTQEPIPAKQTPGCPAFLKGEARLEWNRQVKALAKMGCLAKCDRGSLALYCEAWGEFAEAVYLLAENGPVIESERYGKVRRKTLMVFRNKAAERLIKLADRFGFSPAARARVRAEAPKKDTGPQLDAFKIA